MSAFKTVRLRCDWPDCSRYIDTHRRRLADARADAAREEGWASAAGLDLCGPPTEKQRATAVLLGCEPKGNHAAAAGHRPRSKPGRPGWIHVGCSCGWTDPQPAISRAGVEYSWQAHIRKDVLTDQGLNNPQTAGPAGADMTGSNQR